ncbi:MAG: hypothetical protein AAB706_02360 [Patescibacteria group bacterium]
MNDSTALATPETFVPTVSKARLPSIASPTNWTDLMQFCEAMSKSSLIPTNFKDKPADLAIAISMGNEVGLHWTHAIQSMAVINGRPSLWGDGALAVVMSHPQFLSIDENECTNDKGVCVIERRGSPPRRYEFTLEMARAAGLLGKDTYKQHQGRMLQRRARARAMADLFPDALKGIGLADDLQALPEKDIGGSAAEPTPTKARAVQEKLAARKAAPAAEASTTANAPAPTSAVIDGATGEILDADAIIAKLAGAKTTQELTDATDLARSIKDAAKKVEASAAYKASLKRIREAK